jgi:L-asparaginase
MPRVLLVHTGGTLGMAPSGSPVALAPGDSAERLLEQAPELEQLAELKLLVAFNRDSATLEPAHVFELVRIIREGCKDCDGVVLIHGTDTMAYTASLLGFLLADLGKPVVLTGSQRPLAYVRSDARSNLISALTLATRGVAEVGICFGDHWLRGVASEKVSVHRYQAFESPNLPPLAELGMHIRMHPHAGHFERRLPVWIGARIESTISVLTPFPGMPWSLPNAGTRGVLIQAFGSGNLPMERRDLQLFLNHCGEHSIPVVITSQCPWGSVDLSVYELGRLAADQGAISGGLHTRWAAIVKLGLVLGAGGSLEQVREAFTDSWAGEPV